MRQITHLPADLNQRAVQFARFVQALPTGTHILIINKQTGQTMQWEAVTDAPESGGLTLNESRPYNEPNQIQASGTAPTADTRSKPEA